jgi:hypothetical protein
MQKSVWKYLAPLKNSMGSKSLPQGNLKNSYRKMFEKLTTLIGQYEKIMSFFEEKNNPLLIYIINNFLNFIQLKN